MLLLRKTKLRIIVSGLIAQYPLGGVAWDYLQYVLGFARLGHDVYYFEDTGQWPFHPSEGGIAKDCNFNVKYLSTLMTQYDLKDKWAYCFPWQSQWYGISDTKRQEVIDSADLLINVSGTLEKPQQYRRVKCLVYIDSDPIFTQIKLAQGQKHFIDLVNSHDFHFTFAECLSDEFRETGQNWLSTRQPIIMSEWKSDEFTRNAYTTVMNWTSYKDIVFKDKTYGQKDSELMKFIDLPAKAHPAVFELAVNVGKTRKTPRDLLLKKGWKIADPNKVCPDMNTYRKYIETSKAEWSVAKNAYVKGQSGWFSCRSACYLAAGRPVILQDTGFSKVIKTGEGLFAFNTMDEAIESVRMIEENYSYHSKAARGIAEKYFDSDTILSEIIDVANKN